MKTPLVRQPRCQSGTCLLPGHPACDARNVIGGAHEVRIELRDRRVIFATVVRDEEPIDGAFVIRPWGVPFAITLSLDDLARATPVRNMHWEQQRSISGVQSREFSSRAGTKSSHEGRAARAVLRRQ